MNKRSLVILLLILLFIVPTIPNEETNTLGNPTSILPVDNSILSSDGDESTQSITYFDETSDSDTPLDPDSDTNGDFSVSEWGSGESVEDDTLLFVDGHVIRTYDESSSSGGGVGSTSGSHSDTHASDDTRFYHHSAPVSTVTYIDFDLTGFADDIQYIDYNVELRVRIVTSFLTSASGVWLYDWDATTYVQVYSYTTSNVDAWYNSTTSDSDYWDSGSFRIMVQAKPNNPDDTTHVSYIDYGDIDIFQLTNYSSSSLYVENFSDANNWFQSGNETDDSFSSDGDTLTWFIHDDSNSDYLVTNVPSGVYEYFEIRYKYNTTDGGWVTAYGKTADWNGGDLISWAPNSYLQDTSTDWITKRWKGTSDTVECIYFYATSLEKEFSLDYFRGSPANETGWQHDCSTLEGLFTDTHSDWDTSTVSTDGDIATFTMTKDAETNDNWGEFGAYFDTTTTVANLEVDYYPWWEIRWRYTSIGSGAISFYSFVDGYEIQEWISATIDTWYTSRGNIKEDQVSGSGAYLGLYYGCNTAPNTLIVEVDWFKVYNMINWTYYLSGTNTKTSAVAYYDDSEEAIVLEKEFDTSNDYLALKTENASIGYATTDMVALLTLKASVNTSISFRFLLEAGAYDTDKTYFLFDDYQTIAIPLHATAHTMSYFYVYLQNWVSASPASGTFQLYIKDNITIRPSWYDATEGSNIFSDSFADASDWTLSVGNAPTSDGDLMEWAVPGDDNYDTIYTNVPSLSAGYYYFEILGTANVSGGRMVLYAYPEDDMGGAVISFGTFWTSTSITTSKVGFNAPSGIECFRFYAKSSSNILFQPDYLRIAPANETGWQNDYSTVNVKGYNTAGIIFSNGDVISVAGTHASGGGTYFEYPKISQVYYPFMEFRWKADVGHGIALWLYDEDANPFVYQLTETGNWETVRLNIDALMSSGDFLDHFRFYDTKDNDQEFFIDYVGFYSIADYTIAQHASNTANDYLYVDSGILYGVLPSELNIAIENDWTMSMNTASYPVWNLTMSWTDEAGNEFAFRPYNPSSLRELNYDETRGDFLAEDTMTSFRFYFYDTLSLSAIKFIEDGTAPIISDFWIVPYTPDEEDDLTLAIFETDVGVGTYTVVFNAVDYPAGFVDVDLSATESSNQGGLWSYTIDSSDLPAGYYAFQAIASDGANSVTDLAIFRVTTIYLQITDIVLITATEELAQISAHSNKDCSYQIYENNTLQGSGSVSSSWFSIAWTKDSTAGAYIELGIKFYVGVYSDWINGSYSVASAEVLHITDSVHSASDSHNYLSGHLNLDSVTWTAFDNDTQKDTGSLNTGSFSIYWAKVFARGVHEWGVSFTDGITTRWVNGSYEADGLIITSLIMMQNNESIIVSGFWYTSNITLTWIAYEGNIEIDNGVLTLAESGEYNSIYWEKNEPTMFNNFTLSITADGSTINLHSYSYILDSATYLTTVSGSSLVIYEGDNYLDESTTEEGYTAEEVRDIIIVITALIFLSVFLGGIYIWWDERKKKQADFRAMLGS